MNSFDPALYKPQSAIRQHGQEDKDHPGVSHRSAFHMAQTDHPDLFLDESGQTPQEAEDLQHANQKKQDRIHAEMKKLRTGPDGEMKMSFQKAWGLLRQQKPQLLNFDEAPVSSRPYAQDLPGTQQPAIRMATIRAEKAIADGVAYIEVSSEDYADLLGGKYAQVQGGLVRRKSRRRDPALPPNTGAGVYNISLGRQQMNVAILTLFEGHHHMGVGALINSLKTKTGFKGTVYVFYRGSPPPWESLFTNGPGIEDIKVVLKHIAPSRFLGYHKPFAALEVLERDPELDGVIYADPDVVFLAPWPFFEEWLNSGVALCLDWSHAWLHPNHPWRYKWKELVRRAGLKVVRECGEYPNGGFFGVTRSRSNVLKNWVTATLEFEKEGGDTSKYDQANRLQAVVSDQDLLAAALHTVSDEISYIGEEGMGFNNHFFVLSHAINLKPWCQCFSWQALKGHTPKATGRYWMECCRYPIPVLRPSKYVLTRMDFALAQLISRVWKR